MGKIQCIIKQISDIYRAGSPPLQKGDVDDDLLAKFNIQFIDILATKIIRVIWRFYEPNIIKVNCDGISKGNPGYTGGGGIIRDHHGNFIYAFGSCYYDIKTNMWAEARAAFDGITSVRILGCFCKIWLDLDSAMLVKIIKEEETCPWNIWCIMQNIKKFVSLMDVYISYIYR